MSSVHIQTTTMRHVVVKATGAQLKAMHRLDVRLWISPSGHVMIADACPDGYQYLASVVSIADLAFASDVAGLPDTEVYTQEVALQSA